MITIIISSVKDGLFFSLEENIKKTIGNITYEIIRINNPGIMSIGVAYNKGAKKAKFNHLLFIHEDIKFLQNNWGLELLQIHNSNENIGIIGLAGGTKKFLLPTGFESGIYQLKHNFIPRNEKQATNFFSKNELRQVKTLDGVFLSLTRKRWEELKFSEEIEGFHFYDLDISLRASENFENFVTSRIPIIHYSLGKFDNMWIRSSINFHKRKYHFDICNSQEKSVVRNFWYKRLLREEISFVNRVYYSFNLGIDRASIKNFLKFLFWNFISLTGRD
ncbi:Glycosyltransferase like family protein [Salinimicrobium sediminis]|uniref:Glycosyltransferase like family protein n=1 Tax=Salinimicrobium sediminis TaxID=1343891 RepID=A0A285WZT5_9FLAO|nr:glycosyltransferase [Salinimicrobium sediminis]SOC78582.1 Glycosyltransferase like family protein [Salinimicrobium sediminis]